ncbi:MAG: nuclear transport factor 2 family protein [Pyrinomonadaceae bacterium]
MSDKRIAAVLESETRRCKALMERDSVTLRTLLSTDLVHTHTTGKTEDFEMYMELFEGPMRYINVERRDISVRIYGSTAMMNGIADTTGRMGDSEPISFSAHVLQLWVEEPEGWKMVASHSIRLP